jgi:hypothetical protein
MHEAAVSPEVARRLMTVATARAGQHGQDPQATAMTEYVEIYRAYVSDGTLPPELQGAAATAPPINGEASLAVPAAAVVAEAPVPTGVSAPASVAGISVPATQAELFLSLMKLASAAVSVEQQSHSVPGPAASAPQPAVTAGQAALDALRISGLSLVPRRPQVRVVFQLGELGGHVAFYHWVLRESSGLFLIFDERFEHGIPYSPPKLPADRLLHETVSDGSSVDLDCDCHSVDFVFQFGVFRVACLVVADPTALERIEPQWQ